MISTVKPFKQLKNLLFSSVALTLLLFSNWCVDAQTAGTASVQGTISDSTAIVRYLVLPRRPDGTENHTEEELAALVTRDAMIGVIPVALGAGGSSP